MKSIYKPNLLELLPDSVKYDPKLRASAEALSTQLEKLSAATREVLHLPRLDELDGAILDYLSEQFHLDFYEPLYLTAEEKKNLIREAIAWHRIKGTAAAIEKLAHDSFRDAKVVEWYEYEGGEPYHFKISSKGYKQTPDGFGTFIRMINVAKNVRSWIDNFDLDYSERMEPVNAYIGDAQARWGLKQISLARPPNLYKTNLVVAHSNVEFGDKTISLKRPTTLDGIAAIHVGQFLEKWGRIVLHADPRDLPPYAYFLESPFVELLLSDVGLVRDGRIAIPVKNYWQRQELDMFGATGNFYSGLKSWSLSKPRDKLGKGFIGQGYSFVGTMKISPTLTKRRVAYSLINLGQALTRIGYMTIASSTQSSVDPNKGYIGFNFTTRNYAGTSDGIAGVKTLSLSQPTWLDGMPTRFNVGTAMSRYGYITFNADPSSLPTYIYSVESALAELLLADTGLVRDGRKSWPVNTYTREYEADSFAAQIFSTVGLKTWSLAPPKDEETNIYIAQRNEVIGDVNISPDTKLKRDYPVNLFAAQSNWRQGKIFVDSETKTTVDGNVEIAHSYITDKLYIANAELRNGDIFISKSDTQSRVLDGELTRAKIGTANVRAGFIKVKTADKSSVPEGRGYADYFYLTNKHLAGIGQGNIGVVQIRSSKNQTYRDPRLATVRVGQIFSRSGEVRINHADIFNRVWFLFPTKDNCLHLRFEYPNKTQRSFYVANLREDFTAADVQGVVDEVINNKLLPNAAGESPTGLTLAALLRHGKLYFI